ncbi:hypothetical protein NECID01_1959 [Nematocida sp. AWRm77]|nr:hypothetical protein NECID01_1959 [Nematocida sp. AWRm77]
MIRTLYWAWIVILSCAALVRSSDISSLDFELISDVEIMCEGIDLDDLDYSAVFDSLDMKSLPNDSSGAQQSELQEEQALESSFTLEAPVLSNTMTSMKAKESASVPLPSPNTSASFAISSVEEYSTTRSSKRIRDRVEKEDGEQKMAKVQKTMTTAMATETNTALMDKTEVHTAVKKFSRRFGNDAKVWFRLSPDMLGFAEDLGLRGLTSIHSRKIMELCTASKQWWGHSVFWRMLMFFMDTLFLELVDLNRLEDKKTVVLKDKKKDYKPLSEYTANHIRHVIAKCRGAKRLEMHCSLNVLVSRGTEDVLDVLRWLLYHVNIRCVGVTCDLREAGMSSAVLGRHVKALTKERRGRRVRIDTLALHFNFAQYKDAAVIVKECSWVTVLKIHFITVDTQQKDNIGHVLGNLLSKCLRLEQLSVFRVCVDIGHIHTIMNILPKLVLLEIGSFVSNKKVCLQKKKKPLSAFSCLRTLKISAIHNYDAGIKKFVYLFPNLEDVQISATDVTTSLIDTLSKLPHLWSLEIINGSLEIETAEYLLERLPALECLSVGVKDLDKKLAHALSKCTGMHTLKLRGNYSTGFFASLLQPSPLMNTLRVLCVCRNFGSSYRRDKFSAEDLSSKKAAMKNFGCTVEIRQ